MGEVTGIAWADHTFNAWRGCTRVSPGCQNCYAETMSARNPAVLGSWGPRGPRVPASADYWRNLARWDRKAKRDGVRRRVFVNSLADIFEGDDTMPAESRPIVAACRAKLFHEIYWCENLDFLLLTKRPENIAEMTPENWRLGWPKNVWIGASAEDQPRYDQRVRFLRQVPAVVRWWSLEPLLGPINVFSAAALEQGDPSTWGGRNIGDNWVDWFVVGGESGSLARHCDVAWIRSIVRQCRDAHVACFVKQDSGPRAGMQGRLPDDLWSVKEFPR